jgi:hypothetical protein
MAGRGRRLGSVHDNLIQLIKGVSQTKLQQRVGGGSLGAQPREVMVSVGSGCGAELGVVAQFEELTE